ncbi:helix-turn-helix transcriptional regulator [Rhodococcus opacus]|nr:helix-turn-helix transcriptional regulator [Rhodococcus opacus]
MANDVIVDRVREAMSACGLSQAELAERIGFDRSKMSKSLSGHVV